MMRVLEGRIPCDDAAFFELSASLLRQGIAVRFRASGDSMYPFIQDGDIVVATPIGEYQIGLGDILLYSTRAGAVLVHRVIRKNRDGRLLLPKGDVAGWSNEGWIRPDTVLGRVVRVDRDGREIDTTTWLSRWLGLGYSVLRTVPHRLSLARQRLVSSLPARSRDHKVVTTSLRDTTGDENTLQGRT